jgi:hypothetical protein
MQNGNHRHGKPAGHGGRKVVQRIIMDNIEILIPQILHQPEINLVFLPKLRFRPDKSSLRIIKQHFKTERVCRARSREQSHLMATPSQGAAKQKCMHLKSTRKWIADRMFQMRDHPHFHLRDVVPGVKLHYNRLINLGIQYELCN